MYNANSGLFAACSVRSCFYRLYKSCHVLDWSPLCEYSLAAIDPTRGWLMYLACLFTCFMYCCCVSVDVVLYFTCNTTLLIMIPYPIKEGKRICGSIVFLKLKVCCDMILTPFLSTLLNAKKIIIQLWTHLFKRYSIFIWFDPFKVVWDTFILWRTSYRNNKIKYVYNFIIFSFTKLIPNSIAQWVRA